MYGEIKSNKKVGYRRKTDLFDVGKDETKQI